MEDFFTGLGNVYGSYTKEKSDARDYNLTMAKLSNQTPPTESKALDTAVNNSVTNGTSSIDNKTLMYVGGGVASVVLLALILK